MDQNRFRLSPAESSPRRPTLNVPGNQDRTPWTGLFILTRLCGSASKYARRLTQPCQYKDTRFELRRPDALPIKDIRHVRVAPLPAAIDDNSPNSPPEAPNLPSGHPRPKETSKMLSDRMSGLVCRMNNDHQQGLLRQASVEPDKPLARHPALRARHCQQANR